MEYFLMMEQYKSMIAPTIDGVLGLRCSTADVNTRQILMQDKWITKNPSDALFALDGLIL